MKRNQEPTKGTYTVRLRCTVHKIITCEDCTEEQARTEPYEHATDEMETEQIDWEVVDVQRERP